ncbi:hypothetical protein Tco_1362754 [Tanacetum coccineum]
MVWPEHQSDTQVITVKMDILLEPTSNKLMVERFDTSAGNPVKEILLKLNLPDHRILKDGGEAFKTKKQQRYEHVSPKVTSTQDDDSRLCLVDDLKVLKITYSHTSQDKGTSSSLKSMITMPYLQEKERKRSLRAQEQRPS